MADIGATAPPAEDKAEVEAPEKKAAAAYDYEEIKEQIWRGLSDFKTVFIFPLCTGIMTGVGFMAGKKMGERYFYAAQKSTAN